MSYYPPEAHLDALVAYLRTNLQGYVDQVNAAYLDGLVVGAITPGNVIAGGKAPIVTLSPSAPAIEVAIPDEIMGNFGLGQQDADTTLTIVLRAWQQHVGDADVATEQIYRKSLRLGTALKLCVLPQPHDAFGNHAVCTMLRGSYRVDPATDQREAWTSSLIYQLTVMDDSTLV